MSRGGLRMGAPCLIAALAAGLSMAAPAIAIAQTSGEPPAAEQPATAPSASAPGWQTTVQDPAANASRQQLENQQRALEQSRQQEGKLEATIEQLAAERSQLTQHLIETAKRVQASEAQLTGTEAKLDELAGRQKTVQESLATQKTVLVKLLAALQRMGRDPPPILITERDDALKMVRSAMQLAAVFPQLKDKAQVLKKDLAELDATIAGIKTENAARLAEKQKLLDEQTRLDALLSQKHGELADRQGDLDILRKTVGEQAKTVASLSELITKSDRAVAFKGTLGDADKSLQEAAATPLPDPQPEASNPPIAGPPPSGLGGPPPLPQPDAQASQRPWKTKTVKLADAPPGRNFERARGSLPPPVRGKRILKFGDPTRNLGRSRGEVFQARASAQITSPCDGLVVYAGEFRTFGQILIINAGGGYHVLLAGLGELDAATGQAVVAGEPVGKMGQAPVSANTETGAPILYVEFRSRDKPINPEPWWSGEAEKVQG